MDDCYASMAKVHQQVKRGDRRSRAAMIYIYIYIIVTEHCTLLSKGSSQELLDLFLVLGLVAWLRASRQ